MKEIHNQFENINSTMRKLYYEIYQELLNNNSYFDKFDEEIELENEIEYFKQIINNIENDCNTFQQENFYSNNNFDDEYEENQDDDYEENQDDDYEENQDNDYEENQDNDYEDNNDLEEYLIDCTIEIIDIILFNTNNIDKERYDIILNIVKTCYIYSKINNQLHESYNELLSLSFQDGLEYLDTFKELRSHLLTLYYRIILTNEKDTVKNNLKNYNENSFEFFKLNDKTELLTIYEKYDRYFSDIIEVCLELGANYEDLPIILNEQISNNSLSFPNFSIKNDKFFQQYRPLLTKKLLVNSICLYNYLNIKQKMTSADKENYKLICYYLDNKNYKEAYNKLSFLLVTNYCTYLEYKDSILDEKNNAIGALRVRKNVNLLDLYESYNKKN